MSLPKPIEQVSKLLAQLPGLGPRQALRLTFYLLHQDKETQKLLVSSLTNLFQNISLCQDCFFPFENKTEEVLCDICRNPSRDHTTICVVEKETDLLSLEKTNKYRGLYQILGGLYSNIDDNKNKNLTINQLINRIKKSAKTNKPIREVILALNPTSEGNLTAFHLEKLIRDLNMKIKISRLARGIPTGG
ncbi:MAG: recombination protein RecR, partial [Candidatus Pacebacteria bacterium]|nr:recombination protein RecR [Candidatus Paceibacterota bacterium]